MEQRQNEGTAKGERRQKERIKPYRGE